MPWTQHICFRPPKPAAFTLSLSIANTYFLLTFSSGESLTAKAATDVNGRVCLPSLPPPGPGNRKLAARAGHELSRRIGSGGSCCPERVGWSSAASLGVRFLLGSGAWECEESRRSWRPWRRKMASEAESKPGGPQALQEDVSWRSRLPWALVHRYLWFWFQICNPPPHNRVFLAEASKTTLYLLVSGLIPEARILAG